MTAAAVPSAKEAKLLGEQLRHDPVRNANNAVKLLNCLQEPLQEPLARAAIQALKLFFITQQDSGQLQSRSKRQKLDEASSSRHGQQQQQQQQEQTPEQMYTAWLSRQYNAYIEQLMHLLGGTNGNTSASLQVAALAALMECARHEAGPARFSNKLYTQMLLVMLTSNNTQPEAFSLLFSKYLPCLDVRYYTLTAVTNLAQEYAVRSTTAAAAEADAAAAADSEVEDEQQQQLEGQAGAAAPAADLQQQEDKRTADISRAMFDVLSHVAPLVAPPLQQQDKQQHGDTQQQQQQLDMQSWCGAAEAGLVKAAADAAASAKARRKRKQQEQGAAAAAAAGASSQVVVAAAWANLKVQQRVFGDAWLAFLRTDLPDDIYRKVLMKMHTDVLPAMVNPLLLSDFLTHALDRGGFEGMLALNGIFRLVTQHGLEYPSFYARLYALMTPAAFLHKHRVQFFQLADIFLASGMVPAYTAAAFAKKMARLALRAPPAAAMLAIGFVHNIIRRHPACMVMIHKPQVALAEISNANGSASAAGADVYKQQETDPAKSRAVESSLWELAALRNHYCPQVANMCSVLDKDLSDRVRTSELDIQPLLPASYASLMAQELGKKLRKGVPVAYYKMQPQGLWDAGLVGDDLQGWDLSAPDDTT